MSRPEIDIVHQSLARCQQHADFMDRFYDTFLSTSPEIRQKFAHTDMAQQKRLLEASLFTSILAADNVHYALSTIRHLGERHRDLDIGPELYDLWLGALIETIAEVDDAFDDTIDAAWRSVLRNSIEKMLATY